MVSQAKTLFVNSAAGGIRFLISLLVVIFLTPYIIRHVGQDDFGLWSLVISTLGFFQLLELGFSNALVKYVALYRGMNTAVKRNQAVSTITYVLLMMAAVGTLLIALFSLGFNQWLSIPLAQQNTALILLWIIALRAIILGIPLGIYRGILFGEQKIFLIHVISGICQIAYGISAFLFLQAGYGIISVAWLTLISFLIESGGYALFAYHYWPDLKISYKLVSRMDFKEIAHFSAAQFFANFTSLIVLQSDPLIVKLFFPIAMVGVYAIALKIFSYALLFIKQLLQVITPYIATSHGSGDSAKIRTAFLRIPKYIMFPCTLITVAGRGFASPLIILWMGNDFAPAASVLAILLIAFFLNIPQLVACDILYMTGLHVLAAKYNTLGAFINIAFSLILATPLGLDGIAYGTLAGAAAGLSMSIRKVCAIYGVPFWMYLLKTFRPGLMAGGAQWLVSFIIQLVIPIHHLGILILCAIPGALINTAIYWRFLNSEEKEVILNGLKTIFKITKLDRQLKN